MMGQLAERRMAREESASEQLYSIANDYDDEGDDEDNEYDSEGNAYDNEDIVLFSPNDLKTLPVADLYRTSRPRRTKAAASSKFLPLECSSSES